MNMCVCNETGWWVLVVQASGWVTLVVVAGPCPEPGLAAWVVSHCSLLEVGSVFCVSLGRFEQFWE